MTRLTRLATDFARFAIRFAALVTALRAGDFLLPRFAEDLRAEDLRADDLRADDLRADDLRADDLRADDLRADDLRAPFRAGRFALDFLLALLFRALFFFPREPPREADLRAGDFRPAFLPRDDFLAAAIL